MYMIMNLSKQLNNMKTGTFVKVTDEGEHSTVVRVGLNEGITIPMPKDKEMQEGYMRDAKAILDDMSKEFNSLGMGRVLAAMLYLYFEEGDTGKNNIKNNPFVK